MSSDFYTSRELRKDDIHMFCVDRTHKLLCQVAKNGLYSIDYASDAAMGVLEHILKNPYHIILSLHCKPIEEDFNVYIRSGNIWNRSFNLCFYLLHSSDPCIVLL